MNRRFSRRRLGVEQMKSLRDETSADSQSAVSLEVEFRVLQLGPSGDVVTAEYSPGGGLHGRPVECLDADELRLRCGAVEVEDLEFGSARVVSDDCVGGIGAGQARREHLLRALETPVQGTSDQIFAAVSAGLSAGASSLVPEGSSAMVVRYSARNFPWLSATGSQAHGWSRA